MVGCDHDYVFLIGCGAMACVECAHHVTLSSYVATQERPSYRQYHRTECTCGWATEIQGTEQHDG